MKKVLISGAGVAGLATALQLDKTKYDVTLIEQAPEFTSRGYAIVVWRAGLKVLEPIIDVDKIVEPVTDMRYFAGDNLEKIHQMDATGLAASLEREDLIKELSKSFLKKFGKRHVRFDTVIESVVNNEKSCTVTFKDQSVEEFDIVIGAEGVHSRLRDLYFASKKTVYEGLLNYRWVPRVEEYAGKGLFGYMNGRVFVAFSTPKHLALGYYTYSGARDDLVFEKEVEKLIKNETGLDVDLESTIPSRPFTVEIVKPDSAVHGRIVLAGDGLHARSPLMGYGTSAALEDSASIASRLNSATTDNIIEAFEGYSRERKNRINYVYGLQGASEMLILGSDRFHQEFLPRLMRHGGGYAIEKWIRHVL